MSESVQKKLLNVRPPRVKITYDLETDGASITKELPVVLGIIGDYSGMRDSTKVFSSYKDRKFVFLSSDSFNETLKSMTPRVLITMPTYKVVNINTTTNGTIPEDNKTVELIFESFEDFEPLNIIKKVDFLNKFYEEKRKLTELRTKGEVNELVMNFLNKMITDNGFRNTIKTQASIDVGGKELNDMFDISNCCLEEQKPYARELLLSFITSLETFGNNSTSGITSNGVSNNNSTNQGTIKDLKDSKTTTGDSTTKNQTNNNENSLILSSISDFKSFIEFYNIYTIQIDKYISYYLNNILHNGNFQKLEGSWRGLAYLLSNSVINDNMRIKVLNLSTDELYTDLTRTMEFDQSLLFKKVYESEYGTFGGNPYTCMMLDYAISKNSRDFMIMRKVVEVMAAAHCPLFTGVDPSLFGLKSFANINEPYSISKIFDGIDLAEYKSFRETPDAKYLSLLLPRVMARIPYNTSINPLKGLNFTEVVSTEDEKDYSWMNAAYVYMTQIATSYSMYGWFGSISGAENGGRVDNLPLYIYKDKNGESIGKCPTEAAITDRREKELSDLGFISLCNAKDENYGVFFGCCNTYKPSLFNKLSTNNNGDLSTKTPFMLNTSRFAHYLKCIMRDKVGSFLTKDNVKGYLADWLAQYTLLDDNAPAYLKIEYPLREFAINIEDIIGKPGNYKTIILLRPHDQLQSIEISLRLVAQMPK